MEHSKIQDFARARVVEVHIASGGQTLDLFEPQSTSTICVQFALDLLVSSTASRGLTGTFPRREPPWRVPK